MLDAIQATAALGSDALRLLLANPAMSAVIATDEGTTLFNGAGGYFVLKRTPVRDETELLTPEQARVWATAMGGIKTFKDNAKQNRLFAAHLLGQIQGEAIRRAVKESGK